jgi:hypothetical protein
MVPSQARLAARSLVSPYDVYVNDIADVLRVFRVEVDRAYADPRTHDFSEPMSWLATHLAGSIAIANPMPCCKLYHGGVHPYHLPRAVC